MSKSLENIAGPVSSMFRRWKMEMGSRSRRAPESAVTVSSLLPRERGQAAFRQGINGKTTVPGEGVLLGAKKKAFAAAHGGSVKPQDTFDEGVGFGRKAIGGT